MKNRYFIKYIVVFLVLIIIFITSLTLTSSFSSEMIHDNVKESASVLLEEGNRKIIYIPYRGEKMQFDNYTDALMINTAYSIDSKTPLYSAFVARKNYIPNVTTEIHEDVVGELKSSSKYKYHNEVGELSDVANGENAESFEYGRYWHGYLIVLRPLLLIFNITQLRVILTILLVILAFVLGVLLYRKTNIIVSVATLISLFSVEYFYLGFSLQGIFVFLIALVSTIVMASRFEKIKSFGLLFFVIGTLTNFFDFLTVPLVTLALPLVIYILLTQRKEENLNFKTQFFNIIKLCFLWGIGYGLTWFSKWLLIDLIFGKNMILTAIGQVTYRSVGVEQFNGLDVILQNFKYISITFIISIIIVFISINLKIILDKNHYELQKNIKDKELKARILPYLFVLCIPFAWYFVLQNHSYYHAFFTYRNLMIMVLCINICIEEIFSIYFKKKDI